MGYVREAYMMPRKVREALEGRFSAEVILEVFFSVDDYGRYWDTHRTGDGFDISNLSPVAQGVFAMVLPLIEGYNADYIRRSNVNTDNALAGVEERKKKEERNRHRREKYAAQKAKNDEKSEKSKSQMTKKQTKAAAKPLADKAAVANPAIAHRINGLNNTPSLHSEVLLEKGYGEKPFYAQGAVGEMEERWIASAEPRNDKAEENATDVDETKKLGSNPLGGLACSKAGQTGLSSPVCSNGNEDRGSKGNKGSEVCGNDGCTTNLPPPSAAGFGAAVSGLRPSSARMDCVAPKRPTTGKANGQGSRTFNLLSAPHPPEPDQVLITKKFKIDFKDKFFAPYYRADQFLRRGVEKWIIDRKLGCSVDKIWVCKKIYTFAENQGKLSVLLGIEPDG